MTNPVLDVLDDVTGGALEPKPIERLGRLAELDDEVARIIGRFYLAPLFLPEVEQGGFIGAHDQPGVGTADEGTPLKKIPRLRCIRRHLRPLIRGASGLCEFAGSG